MRDLRNAEWVYWKLCDEYEDVKDSLNFKVFDGCIKVSSCYKNRWFYIIDNSNDYIGIIDDQTGRIITMNDDRNIEISLLKLYDLSDKDSYKYFGFSKCEERCIL